MKKRAVISTAASILLAGAMCMSFVSCGESDEGGDLRSKIDSLTGEEVTEEVWNAAWDEESDAYQNYKIDFVQTVNEDGDRFGKQQRIVTEQCVHADNKDYVSSCFKAEGEDFEAYEAFSYSYYDSAIGEFLEKNEETDNKWVYGTGELDDYERVFYWIDFFASNVIPGLGADFTYSTEEKGYILTKEETSDNGDTDGQKLIVKFAEGKLKAIKYYQTRKEAVYDDNWEIVGEKEVLADEWLLYITYGGQSVERPKASTAADLNLKQANTMRRTLLGSIPR